MNKDYADYVSNVFIHVDGFLNHSNSEARAEAFAEVRSSLNAKDLNSLVERLSPEKLKIQEVEYSTRLKYTTIEGGLKLLKEHITVESVKKGYNLVSRFFIAKIYGEQFYETKKNELINRLDKSIQSIQKSIFGPILSFRKIADFERAIIKTKMGKLLPKGSSLMTYLHNEEKHPELKETLSEEDYKTFEKLYKNYKLLNEGIEKADGLKKRRYQLDDQSLQFFQALPRNLVQNACAKADIDILMLEKTKKMFDGGFEKIQSREERENPFMQQMKDRKKPRETALKNFIESNKPQEKLMALNQYIIQEAQIGTVEAKIKKSKNEMLVKHQAEIDALKDPSQLRDLKKRQKQELHDKTEQIRKEVNEQLLLGADTKLNCILAFILSIPKKQRDAFVSSFFALNEPGKGEGDLYNIWGQISDGISIVSGS